MGYGREQMDELEATLNAMPADLVLAANPIDLTRVLTLEKPVVRVRYELEELPPEPDAPSLGDLLAPIVARAREGGRGGPPPRRSTDGRPPRGAPDVTRIAVALGRERPDPARAARLDRGPARATSRPPRARSSTSPSGAARRSS